MPEQESDEPTLMLPLARAGDDPHTAPIPVFADATGRRRRAAQRIAVGAFIAAGGYSLMVLWSFLGGPVSPDTLMPFSTPNAAPAVQSAQSAQSAQPTTAGTISVPPAPSTAKSSAMTVPTRSANPSASATKSPSASATASPSPSASTTAHRTTGSGKPGKTSGPGHGG